MGTSRKCEPLPRRPPCSRALRRRAPMPRFPCGGRRPPHPMPRRGARRWPGWLAYLRSRLLLPDANAPEGESAEDRANALALRLRRLEAIRGAAEQLFGRAQLDRDVFARGEPEPIALIKRPQWSATLYDLLSAYAAQRQRHALSHLHYAKRTGWSLAEAR